MQYLQSTVSSSQSYLETGDLKSNSNSIPVELLEDILKLLPLNDQLNVESVCRKWNRIVKENRISAVQYKRLCNLIRSERLNEISIPFYHVVFNSKGEIFQSETIDSIIGLSSSPSSNKVSPIKSVQSEMQVSKTLAKKIFQISMREEKVKEQQKEIALALKEYFQEPIIKDNGFGFISGCIRIFNETFNGAKESIEAFVYEKHIHNFGVAVKVKEIFIPSLKMIVAPGYCRNAEKPQNEYRGSVSAKIESPLTSIRFPIGLFKQIDQNENLKKEIAKLREEISPELEGIWSELA